MLGVSLAMLIAVFMLILGRKGPDIYKWITTFLFFWYVSVASLVVFVLGVLALSGSAIIGSLVAGFGGLIIGSLAGSALVVFILVSVAFAYALQIIGAHLLRSAPYVDPSGEQCLKNGYVVAGLLLIFIGVVILPALS